MASVSRRAQLLAGLVADEPPRAVLAAVFQDAGEQLRVFAVRAAVRAGTEGVELLIEQLSNEASGSVLEACVRALGESRNQAALTHLLDLLFEPAARQHWPHRSEDLVLDDEGGRGRIVDGWAALIHNALADAGVARELSNACSVTYARGVRATRMLPSTKPAAGFPRLGRSNYSIARWRIRIWMCGFGLSGPSPALVMPLPGGRCFRQSWKLRRTTSGSRRTQPDAWGLPRPNPPPAIL